jgi:hypothetical protein
LIREAIAANRKAALEKRKLIQMHPFQSGGSSTKIELTPEAKIIADNFKANRGRYLILLKRIYFIRLWKSNSSTL